MSVAKPPGQKRGHAKKAKTELQTVPIEGHLPAPAHLGPLGQSVWSHVTTSARPWLQDSDLPMVVLLCEAYERRATYIEDIDKRGAVLEETRYSGQQSWSITVPNPAVAMLEKVEVQITRWLSLLGLSPSDRGRLGLTQAKAASTLERLRQSSPDGSKPPADSSSPSTSPPSQTPPSKPEMEPES